MAWPVQRTRRFVEADAGPAPVVAGPRPLRASAAATHVPRLLAAPELGATAGVSGRKRLPARTARVGQLAPLAVVSCPKGRLEAVAARAVSVPNARRLPRLGEGVRAGPLLCVAGLAPPRACAVGAPAASTKLYAVVAADNGPVVPVAGRPII